MGQRKEHFSYKNNHFDNCNFVAYLRLLYSTLHCQINFASASSHLLCVLSLEDLAWLRAQNFILTGF